MFGKPARTVKADHHSKVSIADAGPCEKSLRLEVGPETIRPVREQVLEEFRRQATLPGFRKGKAPAELIEQHHAQSIQDETLHRVTKLTFEQIVKEHDLKPVGPIELSRVDFNQATGLILEATVEVEPSFKLGTYKGIALTRRPVAVTPEEVEQGLNSLQESMAQLVPKGEGQPKERSVPALDDELAKDVGFENLQKLRGHVEAKLREQKRMAQVQALEAALNDELLKRHPFGVPPKLVSRQAERLARDFKARLLLSSVPEATVDQEMKQFADRLRQSAEQQVKLSFILDRIADQEAMTVAENEILERLWRVAQRSKRDPVEVRKLFDTQGLWPSVISTIRQEKTMALLMKAAVIDEGGAV